jgi:hypothetical protein
MLAVGDETRAQRVRETYGNDATPQQSREAATLILKLIHQKRNVYYIERCMY